MVMAKENFPRNWLIVDDHVEDTKLIAQAVEDDSRVVEIAHDLNTAEYQLKSKIYDMVVLDYYFKGTARTGVDLIPLIRNLFPGLPLIMVSSSDEPDIVREAMKQGADVFVKKYPNPKLLRTTLNLAAIQAQESRARLLAKSQYSNLFMTPELKADLSSTLRKRSEKVLITGHNGMGKTSVAEAFAASFIRTYYKGAPRSIIRVDCRRNKNVSEELFGAGSGKMLGLSAFERALGGVLILDNLDHLGLQEAAQLRDILISSNYDRTNAGDQEVSLKQIKIISTSSPDIPTPVASLIAAATDIDVQLETVAELAPYADKIVPRLAIRPMNFSEKSIAHLQGVMETAEWSTGFISLSQFINGAICTALELGKSKVYQADLPTLKLFRGGMMVNLQEQLLSSKDGELLLYGICSGRNFPGAQKLLKKVMMRQAHDMFEGNTSAAAEALGISRTSFSEIGP